MHLTDVIDTNNSLEFGFIPIFDGIENDTLPASGDSAVDVGALDDTPVNGESFY